MQQTDEVRREGKSFNKLRTLEKQGRQSQKKDRLTEQKELISLMLTSLQSTG